MKQPAPNFQRSYYTRRHLISFFTAMTPNLCDKNEPKDTTPKNLFLLDPPKDKMFSMPPQRINTLLQIPLLIGRLTVPWV